ncbi:Cytoplasmic aconitate hydratase [Papilio machaon]|uniref:Cytoplasmic aconitate hydratase n=1 Tax=Papilio machaon TaxID=76193 RepID=A0A0N0PG58_PAPMA|nr:Cytoplasmic aconitate hydratase [Papilio machaon]
MVSLVITPFSASVSFVITPSNVCLCICKRADGSPVFLRDIWPTRAEIQQVEDKNVIPSMFKEVYSRIELGSDAWQALDVPRGKLYGWDINSTYIKKPPFFDAMTKVIKKAKL